ncbi:streptodornase [Streptococcus intermedius]|uniref:streptodornase n=1 Tax=Streptococcus intermedius TaxID=1338 RepID=UPI000E3E9F69|nr:streptodornase [Streptococcus intermedius]
MMILKKTIAAYSCILLTCIILSGCSSNTEATKTISSSSSSAKISLSSSSSSTQKDKKEQEEKAKAEKERIAQEEAQKAAEAKRKQEEAQKAAAAQQQERTVYVARNGAAGVYWYNINNMPRNTRFDRVVSMTEAAAITAGKRHSSRE